MSAAPQQAPSRTRKPRNTPRSPQEFPDNYGRDPLLPSEQFRQMDGWTPFPHAFLADLPRLLSSPTQWVLVMFTISRSVGRKRKKEEEAPEWTQPVSIEELAQICGKDVRHVQREIEHLTNKDWEVLRLKRVAKGKICLSAPHQGWQALPSYTELPRDEKKPPASDDDMHAGDEDAAPAVNKETRVLTPKPIYVHAGDEDAAPAVNKETRVLTPKPIYVRAGRQPRPVKIDCGVKSLAWDVSTTADMMYSAVVNPGGLLVLSGRPAEKKQIVEFPKSSPLVSNNLDSVPRHIRRGNGSGAAPASHSGPVNGNGASEKSRSNDSNDLTSFPRHIRRGEVFPDVTELVAGLTQRNLAVDADHAQRIRTEIGPLPLDFYFKILDQKIKKAQRRGETYDPVWLVRTAKDAASAWNIQKKAGENTPAAPRDESPAAKYRELAERMRSCPKR